MAAFSNCSGNEIKIRFCPYCGGELDKGAHFCKSCGSEIVQKQAENPSNRKIIFEGTLHKCPCCGEVLQSFITICPACGHELRDVRSTSAVRELAVKLERISAQKMPEFREKKSVLKMVFGKDFNDDDEAKEAQDRFNKQQKEEKASLIINFSVPNTKEDILEFIILAASNIDAKHGIDDPETKAWIAKLNQVYKRAEITMRGQPALIEVKDIYDQKKSEINKKKTKKFLITAAPVVGWFFLFGMLWNPTFTIAISIALIVLIIVGFILFRKKKK